jgi:hypothetical protein
MVYFEHILEGNIPTRILTTILNSAPHLKTQLNLDHYQINDFNKKEISYKTIMNSCYGKLIMTSLKLNRLNISNGLKNMFKDALYMAISKNSNKINQLKGLPSPNNVLLNQIVNSIVTDFTKSIEEVVKKIQLSCHEKEIILSILHLTGITNKNSHKIKNVKSKLRLNLELPKDLGNFSSIDIMSSIKQMMTYNNINVCKNSSLDKCIFTDTYLNKLTEYFLRSLDEIFNQIINYVKVHHFLEIYSLSITLLDYFAKYNLKKVEKLDNTQYEDNNLEVENLDNTQYEDNNLEVENLDNTQYEDNNLEVENLDNTQYEDNNLEVENLDNTQYEDNNLEVENLDNTQYEDNNLEVENLDNTQYEDNNLEVENLDNTQYEDNNLEVENLDNTQYEDNNLEVENLDNTQYEDNNLEVENLDNTQYEDNNLEVENLDNTQYEDNLEVENLDNTQYEDNLEVENLDNTRYEEHNYLYNLGVENLDNTQYEENNYLYNLGIENLDNTQYEENNYLYNLGIENLDNTQYEDNNLEVENLDNTQYEDNNLEVENLDNTQYEDNNLEVENLDNTQYEDNNLEVENLDNTQYEEEKSAEYFARYNLATIENLINLDNDEYNLIENMAIDIGGKTKLVDNTTIKQLNEMETNIDQSKVISGITKMLGKVITNVVSRNKGDLMRTLAISNNLNITSATGTSFSFKKVNQSVKIDSNVQANIVQNITNKIQNDVVNEVKTVIDSSTKEMKKSLDTKVINEEKGSTIGEVANSFFDAVKDVLKVSIGNNLDKSKGTEISNETKEKLNLNQSFKVNKPDDVDTAFENVLKPENLASCIAKTDAGNKIDLGKIDVTGAVTIEDVTQVAVLNDVMSCAFNQTVLTDISSKILNNFNKLIKNMVENISDKVTKEERSTITGDIALLGTAGKKILEGAGTAAEGVGKGVSTGAEGIGKGVSTGAEGIGKGVGVAAEGIGKGISNMFGGLTNALIVGGIVMVVFGALFIYIKSRSSSASEEED